MIWTYKCLSLPLLFSVQTQAENPYASHLFAGVVGGWQNSCANTKSTSWISNSVTGHSYQFVNAGDAGSHSVSLVGQSIFDSPAINSSSNSFCAGALLGYESVLPSDWMIGGGIGINFSNGNARNTKNIPLNSTYSRTTNEGGSNVTNNIGNSINASWKLRLKLSGNVEIVGKAGKTFGIWTPFLKVGWGFSRFFLRSSFISHSFSTNYFITDYNYAGGYLDRVSSSTTTNTTPCEAKKTVWVSCLVLGGGVDVLMATHWILGFTISVYLGREKRESLTAINGSSSVTAPVIFSPVNVFTMLELKYKIPMQ